MATKPLNSSKDAPSNLTTSWSHIWEGGARSGGGDDDDDDDDDDGGGDDNDDGDGGGVGDVWSKYQ